MKNILRKILLKLGEVFAGIVFLLVLSFLMWFGSQKLGDKHIDSALRRNYIQIENDTLNMENDSIIMEYDTVNIEKDTIN